jgi:hypothetical protein
MIEVIDLKHCRGKYLLYKDVGKVKVGALTHKFEVTQRMNGALIGFVKWYPMWRKYCFYPLDCILDPSCLEEIDPYSRAQTEKHKSEHWKPHPKFNSKYDRSNRLKKKEA